MLSSLLVDDEHEETDFRLKKHLSKPLHMWNLVATQQQPSKQVYIALL